MLKFINDVLKCFRSCFSREATFEWFVVIIAGLLIRTDNLGVTSVIRALFLSADYIGLIGFFRSSAWTLDVLTEKWCEVIKENAPLVQFGGSYVMVGDGVKQSKEGRRMPGVKRHHQESENSSKSDYIFGHLFGGIGILAETKDKSFCMPLSITLQDGVKTIFGWEEPLKRQHSHVVEMIWQAGKIAKQFGRGILLLDRQYLSVPALKALVETNSEVEIVTKAKRTCVAYKAPEPTSVKRGRPRIRGEKVKLFHLFETEKEHFLTAEIRIYGKKECVRYHCVNLLWGNRLNKMLRFVLVEYAGTQTLLVSTDLQLKPLDIIQLYGKRFGIEVMFREMKQEVCAFGYRFWSLHMPKLNRFRKQTDIDPIEQIKDPNSQKRIKLAIKAIEGFMFCAVVTTGLLQMVSLRFSGTDELSKIRYLRTNRNSIVSEATVADFLRKNFFALLLQNTDLTLNRIISAKQAASVDSTRDDAVA